MEATLTTNRGPLAAPLPTGSLAERLLQWMSRTPGSADYPTVGTVHTIDAAFKQLTDPFPDLTDFTRGRHVLDLGCGLGYQAVAVARDGAARVVGVDINRAGLENGRKAAAAAGVADRVSFAERVGPDQRGTFDVVLSLNSMEHFADPAAMLGMMADALRPGGQLLITFSPPWYAPYGSHMYFFTRLPWVHLVFSERTVMAVRSRYRSDGARAYAEVEGGLNRMSVRKFTRLVRDSGLVVRSFRTDPVKGLPLVTRVPGLRELVTNRITCRLERPA